MKRKKKQSLVRPIAPLERITQTRILQRLDAARALVARALLDHTAEVRELLEDALDRLAAEEAVRAMTTAADVSANAPPRTVCAFAADFGAPVDEFLLIPFGEVNVERPLAGRSFVFERSHADAAVAWFDGLSRKLAIDYEHQSFEQFNTRQDGLRPAAGWISGLEVRTDGLWATKVEWTDRARELLASGEYRYFSPVIFWADADYSALAGLGPVALTNDPAMHGVSTLAATRAVQTQDDEAHDRTALVAAHAEIDQLRAQLLRQEADAFVERGLRLGKILDATSMDWRADYVRSPAAAESRLQRAPVLIPPGRVLPVDAHGAVTPLRRTPAPISVVGRGGLIDDADLEAYERAVAAGRVRHTTLTN